MTLSELITASRVNGWNVVDEILYQTYLDTLAGSGGISEQILSALQTFGNGYSQTGELSLTDTIVSVSEGSIVGFLGGTFYNPNNVPVFLKFYADILGASTVYTLMIPALGQVVLDSSTIYFTSNDLFLACSTSYNSLIAPTLNLLVSNIKYIVNP